MKSTKIPLSILMVVFTIGLSFTTTAQQTIQVSLGAIDRPTPQFGYNSVAHVPPNAPATGSVGANWTQQSFIDTTIYLYPEILRYPGGTNTNHWDWKTGWYKPGYQPASPALTIRAEEFKPGLLGCDAEGLFVVNMETSTPKYEMDGLRHYDELGLNPVLFELGNEHNLPSTIHPLQEMSSADYAQLAKVFYDSIKQVFPNAKIAAVGGNTPNHSVWNTDVLNAVPAMDALTFHVYLVADNVDLAFNVNRALAIPFGSDTDSRTLPFRYKVGGFGSLPSGKEVWVTEFNLQENQIASVPVIGSTWTHLLYVTAMNDFFLSKSNVTMVLNHALASVNNYFEAISSKDHHITANGIAMKLVSDVARGSSSCQNLTFSGNPSMSYGAVTIPKLIGWKFDHGETQKGFICNFSKDTFTLSLGSVFGESMDFDTYSGDTTLVVSGINSLDHHSGKSSDQVTIPPFSITQISSTPLEITLSVVDLGNAIQVYPNPVRGLLTIKSKSNFRDATLIVYNAVGQKVSGLDHLNGTMMQLETEAFLSGTYFIRIKSGNEVYSSKFLKE